MEQVSASEADASIVLDEEISKIRSEIQSLTKHRRVLSASLLSSNAVQNALRQQATSGASADFAPVALNTENHAQSNHHRAVFSTTSFPFKDPSPHTGSPNLLGIRIDVCTRDGRYSEPYYVLLKSAGNDRTLLRVHKHTIPAFIRLNQLEAKYLAGPDAGAEDSGDLKAGKPENQDLKRFVVALRRELAAWHLRKDAVAYLQEELGVGQTRGEEIDTLSLKHGISSLCATSLEARYIRFEWRDGRVGRIHLSNQGLVERAVITSDSGRDTKTENLFLRGDRRIETVVQTLLDARTVGK
ncbi:predicted protein [Uncinocarpus reesii 1704]|uniref:Cenp-O kinetochore centromere component n=1 Tax=Uncinocarpus reesii (strain UAMH 1704) TaxID=336963 RepID=C4JL63_UNCRE|nr:uncharacterized protein UREG_00398 [Uncinocarpus reesii 1704]EEP75552.1 predicted protein [Uncinocarpus reesii 1704]